MPTLFDWQCKDCLEEFEDFESSLSLACPKCGAPNPTKLITGTRIDPKMGVRSDTYTTLGDKWARIRRQKQQIDAKRARDHGD